VVPAMHRGEGRPRPFAPFEIAGAKHIHDITHAELIERPDHPKIGGHRPILCACGCSSVGTHNAAVRRNV
jgi:hypothetical protein